MKGRLASSFAASLFAASVLLPATPGNTATVGTAKAACSLVKARVSASEKFPISVIVFCDINPEPSSPKGYYVLALHSRRDCDLCSTNMGWYAVQKRSGRVFEWDVADDRLGPPVKVHP